MRDMQCLVDPFLPIAAITAIEISIFTLGQIKELISGMVVICIRGNDFHQARKPQLISPQRPFRSMCLLATIKNNGSIVWQSKV
jgi:hypothetical protein